MQDPRRSGKSNQGLELRIIPDNVPSSDLPDGIGVGKGQIVSQKEIRGREKRGLDAGRPGSQLAIP